jgi:hypothetical protein
MGRPTREVSKIRLNLDMSPEVKARIEQIRDQLYADSMGEVIRRALAVYDFFLEEQAAGNTIIARREDGTEKEISIL